MVCWVIQSMQPYSSFPISSLTYFYPFVPLSFKHFSPELYQQSTTFHIPPAVSLLGLHLSTSEHPKESRTSHDDVGQQPPFSSLVHIALHVWLNRGTGRMWETVRELGSWNWAIEEDAVLWCITKATLWVYGLATHNALLYPWVYQGALSLLHIHPRWVHTPSQPARGWHCSCW